MSDLNDAPSRDDEAGGDRDEADLPEPRERQTRRSPRDRQIKHPRRDR